MSDVPTPDMFASIGQSDNSVSQDSSHGTPTLSGFALTPEMMLAVDASPKFCVVCGDKALSCNFGALSCESCKAFFRRNAQRETKLKMKCSGSCTVTVENRTRCKRCRLKKCLAKGMKRDMILSDEQKMDRKRKIDMNRIKKSIESPSSSEAQEKALKIIEKIRSSFPQEASHKSQEKGHPHDDEKDDPPNITEDSKGRQIPPPDVEPGPHCDKLDLSQKLLQRNNEKTGFQNITISTEASQQQNTDQSPELIQLANQNERNTMTHSSNHESNSLDQSSVPIQLADQNERNVVTQWFSDRSSSSDTSPASCSTVMSEDNSFLSAYLASSSTKKSSPSQNSSGSVTGLSFSPHLYGDSIPTAALNKLSPSVKEQICSVLTAFSVSFDQPIRENVIQDPTLIDAFNQCELSIELIVKMAKSLPSFRMFDQDDQITLLKGSVIDLLVTQSMRAFDDEHMRFVIPRCNLPMKTDSAGQHVPPTEVASVLNLGTDTRYQPLLIKYVQLFGKLKVASKGYLGILMCCIVILLFTPRSNFQTCKNVRLVEHWYASYVNMLQVLVKVGLPDSGINVDELLDVLEDIKGVSDAFKETLKKCSPIDLAPLITEVFDVCTF